MSLEEFIYQLKTNSLVKFLVLAGFLMAAYIFPSGGLFTALVGIGGLLLGR